MRPESPSVLRSSSADAVKVGFVSFFLVGKNSSAILFEGNV